MSSLKGFISPHTFLTLLLFFHLVFPSFSQEWILFPAQPDSRPWTLFHEQKEEGLALPPGPLPADWQDGTYWLIAQIERTEDQTHLFLQGLPIHSPLWWNSKAIGTHEAPVGQMPSPIPQLLTYPDDSSSGLFITQQFLSAQYSTLPPLPALMETQEGIQQYAIAFITHFLVPLFGCLGGMGLFFYALHFRQGRKGRYLYPEAAYFGLFFALISLPAPLAALGFISSVLPESFPLILSTLGFPISILFWRRMVSGTPQNPGLQILDITAVLVVILWSLIPIVNAPIELRSIPTSLLLPWYVVGNAVLAVLGGIVMVMRHPRRKHITAALGAAALIPALGFLPFTQKPLLEAFSTTLSSWGFTLVLFAIIPALSHQSQRQKPEASKKPNLDSIPIPERKQPKESKVEPSQNSPQLVECLRSTLYPESIPWDPDWDPASARMNAQHPSTGFHDMYLDENGRLFGFSFMDSGQSTLETTVYAHLVKSEIQRRFIPDLDIPRLLRTVHRRTVTAALASHCSLAGLLGHFKNGVVEFVPLALPPVLLRRSEDGRVSALRPEEEDQSNPALGSHELASAGLRTFRVNMAPGDAFAACAPQLLECQSPSGKKWGLAGLARAFRETSSERADGMAADIIGALKDFMGSDAPERPLQLLLIRRR